MTLSTHARWRIRAIALLLVAGSLAAGFAQPATATAVRQPLTGLLSDSDTTPYDDDPIKLASVTCPVGKTVVGAGWSTNPASSQLRLQFLIPSDRTVLAQVHEDYNWYSSPWSLTVYVKCADRPSGWSLVSYRAASSSDDYHTARANCPNGTVPLGVGVEQSTGQGQIVVTDINPDLTGVSVAAYEYEGGTSASWWIRAYAICAQAPTGWELQSSNNQTAYPSTSEYAMCTAGRTAISAGVDLNGAHGEVALTALRATGYQDDQFGIASATEDETGTPDDWELTGDVICVD